MFLLEIIYTNHLLLWLYWSSCNNFTQNGIHHFAFTYYTEPNFQQVAIIHKPRYYWQSKLMFITMPKHSHLNAVFNSTSGFPGLFFGERWQIFVDLFVNRNASNLSLGSALAVTGLRPFTATSLRLITFMNFDGIVSNKNVFPHEVPLNKATLLYIIICLLVMFIVHCNQNE